MTGGRKPKPSKLRAFEGNRGKQRFNRLEPYPEPIGTDTPAELTDPEAVTEWTRTIVPAIHRRQVTTADRAFAIAHCELWATWRSQVLEAAKHPHVVAVKGRPAPNPARKMANQTLLLLCRVDAELGLTPSSRSRVQVPEEKHGSQTDYLALLPRAR